MKAEELASNIARGFQALGYDVSQELILSKLSETKKLGVTNTFIELNVGNNEYLIRINGQLWPPYTRRTEKQALSQVGLFNIDSSVRLNEPSFQICQNLSRSPHHNSLEKALNSIQSEENKIALCEAVSHSIVRYQSAPNLADVAYPFDRMIGQALDSKKASAFQKQFPDSFKFFNEITLRALSSPTMNKTVLSSHADLLPSSIYIPKNIDFEESSKEDGMPTHQLAIVDWEYCSNASWPHDIALLTSGLTEPTADILVDAYINQLTLAKDMPSSERKMRLEIRLTRFLHNYLSLLWHFNDRHPEDAIEPLNQLRHQMSTYYPSVILTIDINNLYTLTPQNNSKESEYDSESQQSPSPE